MTSDGSIRAATRRSSRRGDQPPEPVALARRGWPPPAAGSPSRARSIRPSLPSGVGTIARSPPSWITLPRPGNGYSILEKIRRTSAGGPRPDPESGRPNRPARCRRGGAWQTGDGCPIRSLFPKEPPRMKRFLAIVVVGPGRPGSASRRAQTPAELERTAAYVAAFQNPDGGFAGKVGAGVEPGLDLVGDPDPRLRRRVDPRRPGVHRLRQVVLRPGHPAGSPRPPAASPTSAPPPSA